MGGELLRAGIARVTVYCALHGLIIVHGSFHALVTMRGSLYCVSECDA